MRRIETCYDRFLSCLMPPRRGHLEPGASRRVASCFKVSGVLDWDGPLVVLSRQAFPAERRATNQG